MNRKLNALIVILMVIAFLTSATPMLASSSDKKESTKKTTSSKKASKPFTGKLNINKASKEELMLLPGIGSFKADDIIKARQKEKFTSADDLLKVRGIGETIVKGLKKNVTF